MMNRQQGAVLVVSLIILLVLTMIGLSGARGVLLGERMTAASRDAKVALEVAESMVRQAEIHIDGLADTSSFSTTGWKRTAGDGPESFFVDSTWTNDNSTERDSSLEDPDGNKLKGRFYIEMAGLASDDSNLANIDQSAGTTGLDFEDVKVFKIVARGEGISGTERILVTLYGKAM